MQPQAELFDWQLKALAPKQLPNMKDPDGYVHVTFELFPDEVLTAAATALGEKKLNPYAIELYKFALESKRKGLPVKVTQLSGVLLTQGKLEKWFAEVQPVQLLQTGVPVAVFQAYTAFHQARIAESEAVLDTLRAMVGL